MNRRAATCRSENTDARVAIVVTRAMVERHVVEAAMEAGRRALVVTHCA
ncbi:hypothetical protein AB4120_16085 [Cupriavidus sp. 2KB_3]|nr:hypothetical protein [Cupriavidus campinensis]